MVDTLRAVDSGLARGVISPGFRMPPASSGTECGDGRARARQPRRHHPGDSSGATPRNLSIVTRPAYAGSSVELRADALHLERYYRWL